MVGFFAFGHNSQLKNSILRRIRNGRSSRTTNSSSRKAADMNDLDMPEVNRDEVAGLLSDGCAGRLGPAVKQVLTDQGSCGKLG